MLRISPLLVIEYCNNLETIFRNMVDTIDVLTSKYNSLYYRVLTRHKFSFNELKESMYLFESRVNYFKKLVESIEYATGEKAESIIKNSYSDDYLEKKIIECFANHMSIFVESDEEFLLAEQLIDICNFWDSEGNLRKEVADIANSRSIELRINELMKVSNNFDNINMDNLKNDCCNLIQIHGYYYVDELLNYIAYNCPSNFQEYNFSSVIPNYTRWRTDYCDYYDYNKEKIKEFNIINDEVIINGYSFDFSQVLPKNCSETEILVYNMIKANVINTMRSLPEKYIQLASNGESSAIVLTCNKSIMKDDGNWGGYYRHNNGLNIENQVVIYAEGAKKNNEYHAIDVVIHELGHKFDDMSSEGLLKDNKFGGYYYTANNTEWSYYYLKYQHVLPSIIEYGYDPIPNVQEFYAEAAVAYFKEPDMFKALCPEVYESFHNMVYEEEFLDSPIPFDERLKITLNTPYVCD